MVKDTDLAYLAGLIDGEGCISIARIRPAPKVKNGDPRYVAKVEIQMSEREPIDHVARLYLRNVMIKKPSANMRKAAYRISWQAQLAADLLDQIVPYLILKRDQAIAIIEFQSAVTAEGRTGIRKTPEQLSMRESYYLKLRQLKNENPGGLGC